MNNHYNTSFNFGCSVVDDGMSVGKLKNCRKQFINDKH